MRKQILFSTLTVVLLLSLLALAFCTTQTFTVRGLTNYPITLSFNQNDYVSGSIVVSGGVTNAINFYITDPNGNNVVSYSDATQVSFSFTASSTGNYTVHMDNTGLLTKTVTFNYNDRAAVLGLPQYTFILLLVAIIVVIVVVIAVLLLLRRRPKEAPKTA
ncbi:MAG TPA: emp24/gp25L/p24 family protein [Candidatus Limnocylindrales bacterium]|nr:emp24/gp25L/p24 family protein [Candidatus Limnocylindrales bacterium]